MYKIWCKTSILGKIFSVIEILLPGNCCQFDSNKLIKILIDLYISYIDNFKTVSFLGLKYRYNQLKVVLYLFEATTCHRVIIYPVYSDDIRVLLGLPSVCFHFPRTQCKHIATISTYSNRTVCSLHNYVHVGKHFFI